MNGDSPTIPQEYYYKHRNLIIIIDTSFSMKMCEETRAVAEFGWTGSKTTI
jgi:hypothetical protein